MPAGVGYYLPIYYGGFIPPVKVFETVSRGRLATGFL